MEALRLTFLTACGWLLFANGLAITPVVLLRDMEESKEDRRLCLIGFALPVLVEDAVDTLLWLLLLVVVARDEVGNTLLLLLGNDDGVVVVFGVVEPLL